MRISDEEKLSSHIKLGFWEKLYCLCGTEPYLVQGYAQRLVEGALGKNPGDFNYHVFQGKGTSIQEIAESALQLPFFADKTCVYVKDWDPEQVNASEKAMLEELFSALGGECVLIFTYVAPDSKKLKSAKARPFFTLVEKYGCMVLLQPREGRDLTRFVSDVAAKRQVLMEREECEELVARVGTDMQTLLHETEKLCDYVGKKGKVTLPVIRQVVSRSVTASVYDLSKLVLKGDYGSAMGKLEDLFLLREAPVGILGALSSHFLDLYRVSLYRQAHLPPERAADAYPYSGRAFVLRGAARDSARIPMERLRRCLAVLARADLALKSTSADDRVILEQAVTELIVILRGAQI